MVIKVDYQAAYDSLRKMLDISKEVKNEIEAMDYSIETLGIFWNSEAEGEYAMRLNADMYNISVLLEKISQSIRILFEQIKKFDDTEKRVNVLINEM